MDVEPREISQEEYNDRVSDWGSQLGVKLRSSIRMLAMDGKGDLVKSLRMKTAKWFGEIDKLAYHFDRHGVFMHKGVGRGYMMMAGNVVHVKGYQSKASIMKMFSEERRKKGVTKKDNTLKRQPEEWFNPIVQQNIDKLADLVAEVNADRVVNATKMLIK